MTEKLAIWFDASSPDIDEVYTVEERKLLLGMLELVDVKRTTPRETRHDLVARRLTESG